MQNSEITKKENEKNNNLPIIWKTLDGRILCLQGMEEQHLLNTLAYINKRVEDYEKIKQQAAERNLVIPKLKVNGQLVEYWIDNILIVLNNRVVEGIEKAKEQVKIAKQNLKSLKENY